MRHTLGLALASVVVLGVTACSSEGSEEPVIVVTTNILGDVVQNVVGGEADVRVLMQPDADPHSFEISAQEGAMMRAADLIVTNGLGLEEGLQQHIDSADAEEVPVLVAGDAFEPLAYTEGDAEGSPDPHFWTDPGLMVAVVDALEERVLGIDGMDADIVTASADAYRAELTDLDTAMVEAFAAIPEDRRNLVTNHHVFGYLAERYDFRVIGAVIPGGTTLASPSASDLRDLVSAIEDAQVTTVFAESSSPDRLVQVLADGADIDVDVVELFTESLTNPGGGAETYLTMMRTNTERISAGLSP
ncbi:ABC transporter substrate-binding protein [Arthrobacter sp. RIT-PI-e]|uniref:zinc ABC transporter substrate-binding protein AztC n=1 Tax=Arthrobacter sp. RIT-PI-e TaxID=1681197 RepID=UPI000675CF82|nr:zinc ABC transporter substrate-binding protein AztC [Arthrobacter sp. RIT-PI-e]KNC17221.1 ABC transporter substrate-binding protein [Arthrobacter sp. RIT-PI-e]